MLFFYSPLFPGPVTSAFSRLFFFAGFRLNKLIILLQLFLNGKEAILF